MTFFLDNPLAQDLQGYMERNPELLTLINQMDGGNDLVVQVVEGPLPQNANVIVQQPVADPL